MSITVQKIHVRYEDDYFQPENPFSFGLIIDKITFNNADSESNYLSKNNNSYQAVHKNVISDNVRVYWNSMSEMFIPTSLWEQTKDLEYRIFEAIAADDLFELMYEPFQTKNHKQYFSNKDELLMPFDLKLSVYFVGPLEEAEAYSHDKCKLNISLTMSNIHIKLNDKVLSDIKNLCQFYDSYLLSFHIKQYRPKIRPITNKPDQASKAKSKLIARDWFQLVIWANRVKKIKSCQNFSKYKTILNVMKKSKANTCNELDKMFLIDFLKQHQVFEWYDLIEEGRMQEFRNIWKLVTYTCNIKIVRMDYYGKREQTKSKPESLHHFPLLRIDLK